MQNDTNNTCGVMHGKLPGKCGTLVFPYVPMQEEVRPIFEGKEGLEKGTLFPGLYLPFFKQMRTRFGCDDRALCELMALHFAIVELGLYLDTHQNDSEAFNLYRDYVKLYKAGVVRYEAQYGPLQQTATAQQDSYVWLKDPWPWEYEGGGK